jgi:hypothetical protein
MYKILGMVHYIHVLLQCKENTWHYNSSVVSLFLLLCASHFWYRSYGMPVMVTETTHSVFASITEQNHESTCQIKWLWSFIKGSVLDKLRIQICNKISKLLFQHYWSRDNAGIWVLNYMKALLCRTLDSYEFSSNVPFSIFCARLWVCTLILKTLTFQALNWINLSKDYSYENNPQI